MNRDKQIEEMAAIVSNTIYEWANEPNEEDFCPVYVAKALYRDGYRKTFTSEFASDTQKAFKEGYGKARYEVAREIFEKINELKKQYASGDIDGNTLYVQLYMLEKKYTEGGE